MHDTTMGVRTAEQSDLQQHTSAHAVEVEKLISEVVSTHVLVEQQSYLLQESRLLPLHAPLQLRQQWSFQHRTDGTVEENCVNTIHAEINAIAQAAKHGVSIRFSPISICKVGSKTNTPRYDQKDNQARS